MSIASKALDQHEAAVKEGKRGLTRQQLIEALAESDMNNDICLDAINEREKDIERLGADIEKLNRRIRALENEKCEDREKIDIFKDILRSAQTEIADLNGYLRRVAEDDHARDGFFLDTQPPGNPIPIARRPGRYHGQANYESGPGMVNAATRMGDLSAGRPETFRDKHWSQW